MATRVISPAMQAWKKGLGEWLKYSWDKEPVLVLSMVTGMTLPLAYVLLPRSYTDKITEQNLAFPREYPTPIRYVEGKTGPPTSV